MIDEPAPKADGLNHAEKKGNALEPSQGGRPVYKIHRLLRKRAYHRVLKRGETWALLERSMSNIMDSLAKELYADCVLESLHPCGLLSLLRPKSE